MPKKVSSQKQPDQKKEKRPSGRPRLGLPRERWPGMLPIDQLAYINHHPAGKRSRLVEKIIANDEDFQVWRARYWKDPKPLPPLPETVSEEQ